MFTESPAGAVWGSVFTALMLVGCTTDMRARRIPNILVLGLIASGLVYSFASRAPREALGFSLAGLVLGFVIWIVFYVVGVIGAGDVKFFSAAGTWLGPAATWRAALVAAVVGGVLAVFFLLRERRFGRTVQRLTLAASSRSPALLLQETEGRPSRHARLPYGVALAAGALAAGWLPAVARWGS